MIFYRVRVQGYTGIDRHRLWSSDQILQGILTLKLFGSTKMWWKLVTWRIPDFDPLKSEQNPFSSSEIFHFESLSFEQRGFFDKLKCMQDSSHVTKIGFDPSEIGFKTRFLSYDSLLFCTFFVDQKWIPFSRNLFYLFYDFSWYINGLRS